MPGKDNPVITLVTKQVACLVIGHVLTVTMCAEGCQLQDNPFEPIANAARAWCVGASG
jgi:aspartate ammonia-lyase